MDRTDYSKIVQLSRLLQQVPFIATDELTELINLTFQKEYNAIIKDNYTDSNMSAFELASLLVSFKLRK
jgi:hypothetical protein